MGNMSGMFLFAFWVIRTLKCEAFNYLKFKLAGIPIRLFEYLGAPILIIACAPCTSACDVHAHPDVTRFTYDANHINMTSPAFVFHSCHIEMRWHVSLVSACRNTMSSWFASHGDDVGMASLCSHHIHITLMTSSCSDCNIIATCMNHDCSHGT